MYRVEIANNGEYLFNVESKGYNFVIDAKGKGVTPPDALLASIGSCLGVYIRKYSEGANLGLKDFNITVEADFSKEPPVCFREIKVLVDLKGAELDGRRKTALLEFIKNCPVRNTLKANPPVAIEII